MKPKLFFIGLFILLAVVGYQAHLNAQNRRLTHEYDACIYSMGSRFPTSQTQACITEDGRYIPIPSNDPLRLNRYENTKYGYSFEYPSNLIVSENAGEKGNILADHEARLILIHNRFPGMESQGFYLDPEEISLSENQTLVEAVKKISRYNDGILMPRDEPYIQIPAQKVISFEETTIGGKPMVKMVSQILPDQGSTEDIFFRVWIEYKPGVVMHIIDTMGLYHDLKMDHQIISSFKFTN